MPSAVAFTSLFGERRQALLACRRRSSPLTWSCRMSTRLPPASRAGAIVYCFAVRRRLRATCSWICVIASAFDEDVAGRVVRERDVDRVDDRDDLEREQEERPRNEELQRAASAARSRSRRSPTVAAHEDRERDPVPPVEQHVRRPRRERVREREQRDLHRDADRAREERDQPRHRARRAARSCGIPGAGSCRRAHVASLAASESAGAP